jgi:hypothetical protein
MQEILQNIRYVHLNISEKLELIKAVAEHENTAPHGTLDRTTRKMIGKVGETIVKIEYEQTKSGPCISVSAFVGNEAALGATFHGNTIHEIRQFHKNSLQSPVRVDYMFSDNGQLARVDFDGRCHTPTGFDKTFITVFIDSEKKKTVNMQNMNQHNYAVGLYNMFISSGGQHPEAISDVVTSEIASYIHEWVDCIVKITK